MNYVAVSIKWGDGVYVDGRRSPGKGEDRSMSLGEGEAPKTSGRKMRAETSNRKRWYDLPEEVDGEL